ncbi:MAG: beta-lactamase family protein [bacterium]|nr:beta-lactamase family protein [bacterium]
MASMELLERIQDGPLAADLTYGAQLHVRCGRDHESAAVGAATVCDELTGDHSFNLYCGGKPFATASFLAALEIAGVPCGPTVRVGELLGRDPRLGPTLADLLAHRLKLGSPDLFQFLNAPQAMRPGLLPTDLDLINSSGAEEYSAIALPVALDGILRKQTGRSLGSVVDEAAGSLGLNSVFCRSVSPPPIATYVERAGDVHWPLLHDQLPSFHDSRWGHMTGLYGCAAELGRWLGALLLSGDRLVSPGLPSSDLLAEHMTVARKDATAATGQFKTGFAILHSHGLHCSKDAIGHWGFVRSSLIYCNPSQDVVFVGIVRDLRLPTPTSRLESWQSVIDLIEGRSS